MSKTGDDQEEENECFYESLDRINSSTNSSCSNSSSDDDEAFKSNSISSNYAPMGVFHNYDIWISEPSSVEERRRRLLRQIGLSHEPSLSRQMPSSIDSGGGGFDRSESSDQITGGEICFSDTSLLNNGNGIVMSKSDSAVDQLNSNSNNSNVYSNDSNSSVTICYSPEVVSIDISSRPVNNEDGVVKLTSNGDASLVIANGITGSPNKPPTGKFNRTDSARSKSNGSSSSLIVKENGGGEVEERLDCDVIVRVGESACTIKNLDNGKEFVVNEVRGDGTWNKLKEVSTGRQLTIEEFEMCVGHSPIVKELMRRQNVEDGQNEDFVDLNANGSGMKSKKKGSWFRSIKNVASSVRGHKDRRSSDEKDTLSERGGRRSSSATDDSQDVSFHGPERVRVRQYGKSIKELTGFYKSQEIQAHGGSIWTMKFSLDGRYLASAGEDCVIRIWQVIESERKGDLLLNKHDDENLNLLCLTNGSPELNSASPNFDSHTEKKRRGRTSVSRKSVSFDRVLVPENIFALSDKPFCSFHGHLQDVLDLSWSKSQHLLSSSMDKTVRLWHLSSKSCLKTFSHSDYVTCIQFNPVDDRYFISGSLDAKVRIWSIPDHQVVDWNDLHEMVTAACYTPDGQAALVGSYKGSCRMYNTTDNKLQSHINLQNKKKKPHHRKITGFQFAPGSTSEVFVTSADSRIRVVDGVDLVHKFKGFHNSNSQISASLTANGKYVVCASDDNHVYIWKHEGDSRPGRTKGVTVTQSYEYFHCQNVSAAIPWPGMCDTWGLQDSCSWEPNQFGDHLNEVTISNHPPTPVGETNANESLSLASGVSSNPLHGTISTATNSYFFDRMSTTWPEEKLPLATKNRISNCSDDFPNGVVNQKTSAWGMVIVTAGLRGDIRTYQNFGLPVRY